MSSATDAAESHEIFRVIQMEEYPIHSSHRHSHIGSPPLRSSSPTTSVQITTRSILEPFKAD